MPTYNYRCENCQEVFELIHPMKDETEKTCPHCIKPLKKLVIPTTIIYKVGGFYSADNKK